MKRFALSLGIAAVCGCGSDSTGPTPVPATFNLAVQIVASGFTNPVYVTTPPGDSRLFVVEQGGRIRIVDNGQILPTPFLDIASRITSGGERGLLSVAFHPQYKTNGFFYVYFTGLDGAIRVERFSVSSNASVADASSSRLILTVPHSFASNHNGGLAMFGPDGMLYLGLGDGGGGGDPLGNGQNKGTLLASLLRIDVNNGDPYSIPSGNPYVNVAGARAELWAIGLFYSDYCLGFLKSFRYDNGAAVDQRTWNVGAIGSITSFGKDNAGELYLTSSNGRVYKIVRVFPPDSRG